MLSNYPVLCQTIGCGETARYKIAAAWSDGLTRELKTYALCCPACIGVQFRLAEARQANCRLSPTEVIDAPQVYAKDTRSGSLAWVREPGLQPNADAGPGLANALDTELQPQPR